MGEIVTIGIEVAETGMVEEVFLVMNHQGIGMGEEDMEDSLEMGILGMVGETESLLRRGLNLPLLQDPSQKRSLTVEPRSPVYLVELSQWIQLRGRRKLRTRSPS